MFKLLVFTICASGLVRQSYQKEYIENGDMESPFKGNWKCKGQCTLEESSDSFNGLGSAKITNRDQEASGLSQVVSLTAGLRYKYTGHIKLLNTMNNAIFHSVDLIMQCKDSAGKNTNVKFGRNLMVQPGVWTELGAILKIPTDQVYFKVWVRVNALADYVADDFSLTDVPDLVDWKTEANARIDQLRKANMSLQVLSSAPLPGSLTVEVKQIRSEFPFGSAVGATEIVDTEDPTLQKYQDFFYDNFEFAGFQNALKWKPMEKTQGDINYERPWVAMKALRSKGYKLRGHAVVWNSALHVPNWFVDIENKEEFIDALETRMDGVIKNTTGMLEQWDVNNEYLHNVFFENRTGDANITMKMFEFIHAIDPDVKLFFNDYGIIETRGGNQKAWAIKFQAQLFKAAGVPIHGIGMQSHIKNSDLDITAMKSRLDEVAKAGLPVWVTEFTVEEWNKTKQARALEDALTLYFSHPIIEGIVLWGFWDGKMGEPKSALVEGPDMIPNAGGLAYQKLFKETWRTYENIQLPDTEPVSLRGFKGNYTVTLKVDGVLADTQNVILGNNGASVVFNLDG